MTTEPKPRFKALQSSLHAQCLLCGADHPQGLRLVFSTHADGHVEANGANIRLMGKPLTQEPCRRPAAFDATANMPATMA